MMFEKVVMRTVVGLSVVLLSLSFFLVAMVSLLAGLFLWLKSLLGTPLAAMLLGLFCFALALGVLAFFSWSQNRTKPKPVSPSESLGSNEGPSYGDLEAWLALIKAKPIPSVLVAVAGGWVFDWLSPNEKKKILNLLLSQVGETSRESGPAQNQAEGDQGQHASS